ncbi:hypothetical protein JTB14_024458 [Gonioctena quinquepunctata]|nr:hypothetical protein JTB14_024458 [Gonioctena quinquepunctata]
MLGHAIVLLLLAIPLHVTADYNNYYEYVEEEEDYENPELLDYEPDNRERKDEEADTSRILHHGVVTTVSRGDTLQLNCTKHDLGGCAKRFLSVENGDKSLLIFEQENLEIDVDDAGNYTCGCFLPEENFKNITYKVVFQNDTAEIYKEESWGKYDAPRRSSSAFVLGSPAYFMWMWIMFIYTIGR